MIKSVTHLLVLWPLGIVLTNWYLFLLSAIERNKVNDVISYVLCAMALVVLQFVSEVPLLV